MKLIADQQIQFVSEFFTQCDELTLVLDKNITKSTLKDADALLVRTVTPVNKNLLENTQVKFVGAASTGIDHIDHEYLKQAGIVFADAAGCNANAVLEYVLCCVASLKLKSKSTIGIVGCGRIGSLVAHTLDQLGFKILCCDPLLLNKPHFDFVSLETILSESDFITIHTPLTQSGAHPTFHLFNQALLKKAKNNAIILNTARGSVIDQRALLNAKNIHFCLDVWENEPDINVDLLNRALIATPHIAGYTIDAKRKATELIYNQAAAFFNWKKIPELSHQKSDNLLLQHKNNWAVFVLSHFNPMILTQLLKNKIQNRSDKNRIKTIFLNERNNYPLRKEFN